MIVLDLNAKTCMSHLLLKPTFHRFSLIEGEIDTFCRFQADGRLHPDFFDEAPGRDYARWEEMRTHFLAVIRGTRTPLYFKIVLSLAPEDFAAFLHSRNFAFRVEEIQGLYLNFRYDGKNLQCITGVSTKTFQMDRTLEREWDAYVKDFFARNIE